MPGRLNLDLVLYRAFFQFAPIRSNSLIQTLRIDMLYDLTQVQLDTIRKLADMPKKDLRLLVGADESKSSRMDETRGFSRGDLIVEAIERGITNISGAPY